MTAPKLDSRDFDRFHAQALELARIYCPDWAAYWPAGSEAGFDNDPGQVMLKLFSLLAAYIAEMENDEPDQRRLAFYQFVNLQTRPPVQAEAPLSFTLREGRPPLLVPADTVVVNAPSQKIRFQTDEDLLVIPAAISGLRSIIPAQDSGLDLMPALGAGQPATLFSSVAVGPAEQPLPHWFLMGDSELFKPDPALQKVTVRLTGSQLHAEFFTRWYDGALTPLSARVRGQPGGLELEAVLDFFPAAGPRSIADLQRELYGPGDGFDASACAEAHPEALYWLLVRPALDVRVTAGLFRQLPRITGLACTFSGDGIPPQQAASTQAPLDIANGAYPFGETPATQDAFYIRSDTLFVRIGARIVLTFNLRPVTTLYPVELDWQFHDGTAWTSFNATPDARGLYQFVDTTNELRGNSQGIPTRIEFLCPPMQPVAVSGAKGLWVRAVIASGGYGRIGTIETAGVTDAINAVPDVILHPDSKAAVSAYLNDIEGVNFSYTYIPGEYDPPYIGALHLGYSYAAQPKTYWTYNTFALEPFLFRPYEPVPFSFNAVFLALAPEGMAEYGVGQPLTLYFRLVEETSRPAPPLQWWVCSGGAWQTLPVDDSTANLTRSGIVSFTIPAGMTETSLFSQSGYWFRIDSPDPYRTVQVWSITPNSVMGGNRTTIIDEVLGSSNERPSQRFVLAYPPVLAGLVLDVVEPRSLEPPGGQEDAERPLSEDTVPAGATVGDAATVAFSDSTGGDAWNQTVVRRWRQVDTFAFASPKDRVYTLDNANGIVTFGDGRHGMIPPSGHDNIIARRYDQSQGEDGNVAAGTLTVLKPGISDIEAVFNPAPAGGGVEGDTAETVSRTGPARVKAGGHAVQTGDMSILAEMASPQVWRARANPVSFDSIVISVLVRSRDLRPYAGPALLDQVTQAVRQRCLAPIAHRISAAEPVFLAIDVTADVSALVRPDRRNAAQAELSASLAAFLHPVSGGPTGEGWRFGAVVTAAAIARAIRTDRRVTTINSLSVNGHFNGSVKLAPDQVPTPGAISVIVRVEAAA